MSFSVVLDTCVLYPAHLRDTLLRLAEQGLYRALWSSDIVEELRRNLIEDGFSPGSVVHLIEEMTTAFPDAVVAGHRSLIDGLTCDPKDRHVLAAAVEVIHTDTFLLDLLDLAPRAVTDELGERCSRSSPRPIRRHGG